MKASTVISHVSELSKSVITKNEINAISKFINSLRFSEPAQSDKSLGEYFLNIISEKKSGYKLEKNQTDFGIKWLKGRYFKLDGTPRKQAEHDFGTYDQDRYFDIIKNFKEFRFIGYRAEWQCGCNTYLTPVYKVISKNGDSFTYSPVHMRNPFIDPEVIKYIF